MIRQRIRFTGRVQAVGFRYRAKQAAAISKVTGFVRNEYDGSVIMEVQGTLDQIGQTIAFLYASPYIRIDGIERENVAVKPGESDFRVHHI